MRMQYDRDRRATLLGGMKTAFESTGRAVENYFGHFASILSSPAPRREAQKPTSRRALTSRRQRRTSPVRTVLNSRFYRGDEAERASGMWRDWRGKRL